jgi:hypothetical protein
MTTGAASDHGEGDRGLAAELLGDGCEICGAQFAVLDAGDAGVRQPIDIPAGVWVGALVNILTTATAVVVVKVLTRTSGRVATLQVRG